MTLSGFTFIRNGFSLGYPFQESLASLLPLCDELVVAVGDSTDGTREYISSLENQTHLTLVDTIWDENKRAGGHILAEQTNIALDYCTSDWCLYLQGDEVLHEDDYECIRREIHRANNEPNIEGLIFRWHHFFGSHDYVGAGRQWYRREVRAIRNTGSIVSWGDAQGFRVKQSDGTFRKIRARQTKARIFHYGWVRHPRLHIAKSHAFQRLYHDDAWLAKNIPTVEEFRYQCYQLEPFKGTHPSVMHHRIARDKEWTSHFDPVQAKMRKPLLVALTDSIESVTSWRIGEFRNFSEV